MAQSYHVGQFLESQSLSGYGVFDRETNEVTVTDAQNATVTEQFSIRVIADTEAPQVQLRAIKTLVNVGEAITFEARAIDNVSVAGLMLSVNGQAIVLDANGRATVQYDSVQTINAMATAMVFDRP